MFKAMVEIAVKAEFLYTEVIVMMDTRMQVL